MHISKKLAEPFVDRTSGVELGSGSGRDPSFHGIRSKFDPESDLSLAAGKHLTGRPERLADYVQAILDSRRILSIEHIEKLEQDLSLYAISDIEPLRKTQIKVHKRVGSKSISSRCEVNAIEVSVAVRIPALSIKAAEVKSALSPENAADLELPRKLNETVHLEDMIQSKA
jgi:hypothetical protein